MQKILSIVGLALLMGGLLLQNTDSVNLNSKFQNFKIRHGRAYTPTEEMYRFAIYAQNMALIEMHNADKSQTYFMAETQFSDLTQEEFVSTYLTVRVPEGMAYRELNNETTPILKGVDWRGITRVKDQGQCGSCWAFSAVSAAESYFYVKKSQSVDLSEQQLVDCEKTSFGCSGGYNNYALQYIQNKGLVTQGEYPYRANDGNCQKDGGPYRINGVQYVGGEGNLRNAINEYPVSVLVDASNWNQYGGGVLGNCGKSINHAVTAVGYQDDGAWIIKNSWSAGWGEAGHIRLAGGDTCGVTGYAYRAV